MSKKLDSIIKRVPPAISRDSSSVEVVKDEKEELVEKMERIVAVVPSDLKKQIKQYIVDHPGDTEKTILLKGLLSIGFYIDKKFMKDNRGKK